MILKKEQRKNTALSEVKKERVQEIRKEATRVGEAGLDISVGGMSFHMACTPDDVSFLQQASEAGKMVWALMRLPEGDPARTAEIKEKWYENGVEKTKLHTEVPETIHDAVLFQAALYAREILLMQENLIQGVQDAISEEEVRSIRWGR